MAKTTFFKKSSFFTENDGMFLSKMKNFVKLRESTNFSRKRRVFLSEMTNFGHAEL